MRIGLIVAVGLLLAAQTGPVTAGAWALDRLPCAPSARAALPAALCRDLTAVLLGPAASLSLSVVDPNRAGRWPLAMRTSQPVPLPTSAVPREDWRRHLARVSAGYDAAFGGREPVALPVVPAVLWPGGNPFLPRPAP